MQDPKEIEKILRGPHKYENGQYVAIPYVYQEYPKMMDGTLPASLVNNKTEEDAWRKKQREQRRKERLNSALKVLPGFLREFFVMIIEGITRAFFL